MPSAARKRPSAAKVPTSSTKKRRGGGAARPRTGRAKGERCPAAVGIETAGGTFIQDDDRIALRHIALFIADEWPVFPGEVAAGDRYAHCSEITRRDHVDERSRALHVAF